MCCYAIARGPDWLLLGPSLFWSDGGGDDGDDDDGDDDDDDDDDNDNDADDDDVDEGQGACVCASVCECVCLPTPAGRASDNIMFTRLRAPRGPLTQQHEGFLGFFRDPLGIPKDSLMVP